MATHVRIAQEDGNNRYTLRAPGVIIPFRGTLKEVQLAGSVLAKMLETMFFDVEFDPRPMKKNAPAKVAATRRTGVAKRPSLWERITRR